MPLDAICLSAVTEETATRVTGMKIDKIQQPEGDLLLLTLRGRGDAARLLISAGSGDGRCHLTRARFENPPSPPMFCMLLRKHLTGAMIESIVQPPRERVLVITLKAPDIAGGTEDRRLALEFIGRASNIVLTDGDGVIIDCLRRVGGDLSERRQVLPGLIYRLPPAQDKLDPLEADGRALPGLLAGAPGGIGVDNWLLNTFSGFSPLICRELQYRAYGDADIRVSQAVALDGGRRLAGAFEAAAEDIRQGRFTPFLLLDKSGEPFDYSYTRITQYEGALTGRAADSFSELLDEFHTERAARERVKRRAADITRTVKTALDRAARKTELRRAELERARNRDVYRERGDIVMANIWRIGRGDTLLRAPNLYADDGAECEIELDPRKTPQQNAARYYKEYAKMKNAEKHLSGQIVEGEREIEYLQSVLEEISKAGGESDIAEIRRELAGAGYLRTRGPSKGEKRAKSAPMSFTSAAGTRILVGRNNTQNDELTHRVAARFDIWMHARKTPGSHVIVRTNGAEPDDRTLRQAAALAAWYSGARGAVRVPVDYCPARNVKRQPGGRPGMVFYTGFETIFADQEKYVADGELAAPGATQD
ncbi:MAG: NFACT family protein [Oscillospiraceae bacterium]|jgi:predicted ribosome quality control (RQC) complex YloA/Tae2 family protein|nr:NFACT family protein [Oscillospiraceae bacterium]